ncbi:retrovirus-related pol polyprotein from transposon TNT 1-94 [Tanacetum coccineum]
MAESNVPQLVDKKGGSYSAIAPRLEVSLVAETFEWDEEDVSYDDEEVQVNVLMALADVELVVGKNHTRDEVSDDEEVTKVNVLMALADDELIVGKNHARNGEWIDITMRKRHIRETIWYLDSRCSRSMTSVKSYLHKYVEQPGPKELKSFCDEKGISQNFSYPHTPEQNGVAKRKNKTLIEVARTILNGSVLSKHFWTKASPITHQALTSSNSNQYPQDRWSREQHIKLVNIIGEPTKGMLTRSMVAKLTAASAHECLFANFLYEIEPKKAVARMKAIRIFLAYATYMNFKVFQIDVKSAFMDGKQMRSFVQEPSWF